MITGLVVAISAGLWAGVRLVKWLDPPEHEPRALQLRLPDPNAHVCSYMRLPRHPRGEAVSFVDSCITCRRPPPTLMPGPGQSCVR